MTHSTGTPGGRPCIPWVYGVSRGKRFFLFSPAVGTATASTGADEPAISPTHTATRPLSAEHPACTAFVVQFLS
jgi:hypothetical protein